MRNPEIVLNTLCQHSKVSDYKFERLSPHSFNKEMFCIAYQRIYAKPGNMIPGTDGQTIDQMSIGRIERIIETLRNESSNRILQKGCIYQEEWQETPSWYTIRRG